MWIFLKDKLPTVKSPPALSLFWSVSWPDEKYLKYLYELTEKHKLITSTDYKRKNPTKKRIESVKLTPQMLSDIQEYGLTYMSNHGIDVFSLLAWGDSRKIFYGGEEIRVFPHEFSVPTKERLNMYIFGVQGSKNDEPSHYLVPDTVAENTLINDAIVGEQRTIYDAALLDGANPTQALLTALGHDITLPDAKIPAIGWYRCKKEYGLHFKPEKDLIGSEDDNNTIGT